MPLDLTKFSKKSLVDTEVHPREIFNLLSEKDERYKYPRDVQSQVWDRWLPRRTERDLVVKMNTGGGKTVVGLLMLKSCLNEGAGPAAYFVPDNYLVSQVVKEASDLGIEVVTDPHAGSFLQGRAILVTNIHTLVNGRSTFGTADSGVKIQLGTILIDDAHACITTTENQFTLGASFTHPVYKGLFELFRESLSGQSETTLLEIEQGESNLEMLVPFWAWHAKSAQVAKLLIDHRADDEIAFQYPLLRHHLDHCRCVFTGKKVEISPKCIPMESIPSFVEAKRRLFLTATLADDSILVTDFNADPECVENHITPNVANDIGDRLILIPQEIDPELSEDQLRTYLAEKSATYNVVVIVPSEYRAAYWAGVAKHVVYAKNLQATVELLKAGHVGLVVLVNKYDGIDLPGDACRILVLDGLPQARRLYERVEQSLLFGNELSLGKQIQRIEQGMGRGIRANDDYCVVMLMGASLTRAIYQIGAKERFSPATRAQLSMSLEVTGSMEGGIPELNDAVDFCLTQDREWKRVAKEAVANVAYPATGDVRPLAISLRQAFEHAVIRNYKKAQSTLQDAINQIQPNSQQNPLIGWLKWQLAEYLQFTNEIDAQQILKSALTSNRRLTKPIDGIDYERLDAKGMEQARECYWKLKPYVGNSNGLLVQANGILDDLAFQPDSANRFESAMQQIAELIGFRSQRPEVEFKRGPDVLWAVGNLQYFVIECKNEATADRVAKHYVNQLGGSMNWFQERYDHSCSAIPIMVHPSRMIELAATAPEGMRVMTADTLHLFKDAVRKFVQSVATSLDKMDSNHLQKLLEHHGLTPPQIVAKFTVESKTASH